MPAWILVVDDDPGVRFFLEEVLVRDGYRVVAVAGGREALDEVMKREFDLALIDLRLKDMDGLDLLSALRQRSPDTVPIVLTGYASLESAVSALRCGAHDYLFKPCQAVELRESVRKGLRRRQQEKRQRELLQRVRGLAELLEGEEGVDQEAPPRLRREDPRFLRRGNLVVDRVRHTVTLAGRPLDLTITEFKILTYLADEAPRVVSPVELMRDVLGEKADPWEAREIVRSHVYRIRRKIKAIAGQVELIRTVRGVGYTLEVTDEAGADL